MSLTEKINQYIHELYGELQTQQAVAEQLGVTQTYIHQLLSGKSKTSNITAGVIDKMFPNATIELPGDNSVVNSGSHASGSINHHCHIVQGDHPSAREFLDVLMLSDEFDDALKSKIYRYYSGLYKKEQK